MELTQIKKVITVLQRGQIDDALQLLNLELLKSNNTISKVNFYNAAKKVLNDKETKSRPTLQSVQITSDGKKAILNGYYLIKFLQDFPELETLPTLSQSESINIDGILPKNIDFVEPDQNTLILLKNIKKYVTINKKQTQYIKLYNNLFNMDYIKLLTEFIKDFDKIQVAQNGQYKPLFIKDNNVLMMILPLRTTPDEAKHTQTDEFLKMFETAQNSTNTDNTDKIESTEAEQDTTPEPEIVQAQTETITAEEKQADTQNTTEIKQNEVISKNIQADTKNETTPQTNEPKPQINNNIRVETNKKYNGLEIYFTKKPDYNVIEQLKNHHFRWHKIKQCWFATATDDNKKFITELCTEDKTSVQELKKESNKQDNTPETITQDIDITKLKVMTNCVFLTNDFKEIVSYLRRPYITITTEQYNNLMDILKKNNSDFFKYDNKIYTIGSADGGYALQNYIGNYKTIKQNNTDNIKPLWDRVQQKNIESVDKNKNWTSNELKQYFKNVFPEVKMSITKGGYSNNFELEIKQSPYFKGSIYLDYIINYITAFSNHSSKTYNRSDVYTDYFDENDLIRPYNFIAYDYKEVEPTEAQKQDMKNFDNSFENWREQEEIRRQQEQEERELQYQKEQEEIKKADEIRQQNKVEIENHITTKETKFDITCLWATLNKQNTLQSYIDQVEKLKFYKETITVNKKVYFTDETIYNNYTNMLMSDMNFINTEVVYNPEKKCFIGGIAVYLNNDLKFVIDSQGYSYARYVGIPETKTDLTEEQINNNKIISLFTIKQAEQWEVEYLKEDNTLLKVTEDNDYITAIDSHTCTIINFADNPEVTEYNLIRYNKNNNNILRFTTDNKTELDFAKQYKF